MPRKPRQPPCENQKRLFLVAQGVPREEWPEDLAEFRDPYEEIHVGWFRQIKELSQPELQVLATQAVLYVHTLQDQVAKMHSELARRNELRSKRGRAAQMPGIAQFKAVVKKEWELIRDPKKTRAPAGFAGKMIGRKGSPVTNPKTVLRWCREWEEELKLAAHPHLLIRKGERPARDVFSHVLLVRDFVCHGDEPNEPTF